MILTIKKIIAFICNILGISKLYFSRINNKYNNYVRVINYHNTEKEYIELFERHIKYLKNKFNIITYEEFKKFLSGGISFKDKPGMLITFDDGYISNYEYGIDVLDKYDVKGLFFISAQKIDDGDPKYINKNQLKEMISRGHNIGCHTNSHYRFNESDSDNRVEFEVIEAKNKLEKELDTNIDSFCYVGGELPVYTNKSFQMIKDNYDYSFTTLTQIAKANTNHHIIHRTNVESFWNLGLVKFQTSGLWDLLYKDKAKQVEDKLLK